MTRLSLELEDRIVVAIDRAAAETRTSVDQTVRQAIELGLKQLRKQQLEAQHQLGYEKHPVKPDEFALHPDDPVFPKTDETW